MVVRPRGVALTLHGAYRRFRPTFRDRIPARVSWSHSACVHRQQRTESTEQQEEEGDHNTEKLASPNKRCTMDRLQHAASSAAQSSSFASPVRRSDGSSSSSPSVPFDPSALGLPVVHRGELAMGDKLGGRALREWHAATLHGTDVVVSRQRHDDNPPSDVRLVSLHAYALLRHPNIITLLGVTPDGEVITEMMEHDLLPRPIGKPTEKSHASADEAAERSNSMAQKRQMTSLLQNLIHVRDIARALAWAHHMGVIHRDIKPSHFLVKGGCTKLGGWMFAEIQKGDIHPKPDDRFHGTPLYMAPELWGNEPFEGKKADVYSFGLSMWEVIYNEFAFSDCRDLYTFREAIVDRMERPELSNTTPAAVNKLIASCWAHSSKKRPSMVEVVDSLNKIITPLECLECTND